MTGVMEERHLSDGAIIPEKVLGFSFKYRCGNTDISDIKPR